MTIKQDCYNLLKKIPEGKITTYKILANKLNFKSYRGIGQVVGSNPNAPQVPCHRVVKSDGNIGGYAFGVDKKIALLKKEGVVVKDDKIENFQSIIHKF